MNRLGEIFEGEEGGLGENLLVDIIKFFLASLPKGDHGDSELMKIKSQTY